MTSRCIGLVGGLALVVLFLQPANLQLITAFLDILPQMLVTFKGQPISFYSFDKSSFKGHPLIQVPQLYSHLNATERKRAALYLYYIIAGFCLKEMIIPCIPDDALDLADRVLTGDKDCSFTCGKKKTKSGFPKLPPTVGKLAVTIACKWYPLLDSPDQVISLTKLGQSLTPDPAEAGEELKYFTLFHMDLIVRHAIHLAVVGIQNMTDSEIKSTFKSDAYKVMGQLDGMRRKKEEGGAS